MTQKRSKSRSGGADNLKLMIVAICLTATLLFWSVFSGQDQRDLIGEAQNPKPAWVINLPPVPTVVPANKEDENPIAGEKPGPEPVPTLRAVTEPEKKVVVPQAGPVIVSGGGGGGGSSVTSSKAS